MSVSVSVYVSIVWMRCRIKDWRSKGGWCMWMEWDWDEDEN